MSDTLERARVLVEVACAFGESNDKLVKRIAQALHETHEAAARVIDDEIAEMRGNIERLERLDPSSCVRDDLMAYIKRLEPLAAAIRARNEAGGVSDKG